MVCPVGQKLIIFNGFLSAGIGLRGASPSIAPFHFRSARPEPIVYSLVASDADRYRLCGITPGPASRADSNGKLKAINFDRGGDRVLDHISSVPRPM